MNRWRRDKGKYDNWHSAETVKLTKNKEVMAASLFCKEGCYLACVISRQMYRGSLHTNDLFYFETFGAVSCTMSHFQSVFKPLAYCLRFSAWAWYPLQEWFLIGTEIPFQVQLLIFLLGVVKRAGKIHPRIRELVNIQHWWPSYLQVR